MCGIYGFNGRNAPKEDKIKILALSNMARGEDSCGIYWDGKTYKGVDKLANIFKFLEATTLHPIEEHFTVIGHNRKSTRGANTLLNCHPFSYYTADQDKSGLPYAVAAHNGTISNREELITKYNVMNHDVDSAEILNIIINAKANKKNINVLEDYEGYGAFVWTFPGENKMYVFRGKSQQGEDTTGERPLFYWKKSGADEIYISSIKESLLLICDDDEKIIKEFAPNQIHVLDNGKMSTLKRVYNREERNKVTTYYSSANSSRPASQIFVNYPDKVVLNYNKKNCKRETTGDAFLEDEPLINVDIMRNLTGNRAIGSKISYCGGKYLRNGHPVGGKLKEGEIVKLDDEGYFEHSSLHDKTTAKEYYFWNGWTCVNGEALEEVCDMYKSGKIFQMNSTKNFDLSKIRKLFNCIIFNPGDTGGRYRLGNDNVSDMMYSFHKFEPLFNQHKKYFFTMGYFKSVVLNIADMKPKEQLSIPLPPGLTVEEPHDVLKIEEHVEEAEIVDEESDEKVLIGGVMMEAMDDINSKMDDLNSLDVSPENTAFKIRVLTYLSKSYEYIKEHWEHLNKTEEEVEKLIY